MSIEELFLRQIDSLDGNIEVIVHPGQPMTCVSTGPFVWNIEHADRDAVIAMIATAMADPDRPLPPLQLVGGELFSAGGHIHERNGLVLQKQLYLASGPAFLKLHFGTGALLVAALSEARAWSNHQKLAAPGEVASC